MHTPNWGVFNNGDCFNNGCFNSCGFRFVVNENFNVRFTTSKFKNISNLITRGISTSAGA
jgi:hypothetical protein